jgi:hypothetical protein
MARIRRLNYDLQELNAWVRIDREQAERAVTRRPRFKYDLHELNERLCISGEKAPLPARSIHNSTAPGDGADPESDEKPIGTLAVLEVTAGLLMAGKLFVMLGPGAMAAERRRRGSGEGGWETRWQARTD